MCAVFVNFRRVDDLPSKREHDYSFLTRTEATYVIRNRANKKGSLAYTEKKNGRPLY